MSRRIFSNVAIVVALMMSGTGASSRVSAQQSAPGTTHDTLYDIVIRNGRVLDGAGNPWIRYVVSSTRPARIDTTFSRDSLATFRGVVSDSSGNPIRLASIVIDGNLVTTYSRGDGSFGPVALLAGHHRMAVGATGYRMLGADFNIVAKASARFTITMIPDGTRLPTVKVTGTRGLFEEPKYSGFEHRRETGTGRYIDDRQIASAGFPAITELLRDFGGATLKPVSTALGTTAYVVQMRGSVGINGICTDPAIYLDGSQVALVSGDPAALDHLIGSREIAGIEVYPGASSVPPQFNAPEATCGVIVIWTKDGA